MDVLRQPKPLRGLGRKERDIMKKLRDLFVLALALAAPACASTGLLIPQVNATLPLVDQLGGPSVSADTSGFTALGNGMFVKNELPIPAPLQILAWNRSVAMLAYGDIGADNRLYQAHEDQVPLAAITSYEGNICAGIHQMSVSSYWRTNQIWLVTPDQMHCSDGSLLSERLGLVPPPAASTRILKMRIPRPTLAGEHGGQIILAYNGYGLGVRSLPGRKIHRIGNGQLLWLGLTTAEASLPSDKLLVLDLLDPAGRGVYEFPSFRVSLPGWQANQNRTFQLLVTPRGVLQNGWVAQGR